MNKTLEGDKRSKIMQLSYNLENKIECTKSNKQDNVFHIRS